MTLEDGVKVSQIFLPIVIAWIGYHLTMSINRQTQSQKLLSDFNIKWSDQFISKCVNFNASISGIQLSIFEFASATEDQRKNVVIPKLEDLIAKLNREKYEIEVHSALIEDNEEVIGTIDNVFKASSDNIKALKAAGQVNIDFESIKILQTKLNRQLKDKQQKILKLQRK